MNEEPRKYDPIPEAQAKELVRTAFGERLESAIEEWFFHYAGKFMRSGLKMEPQVEVPTILGTFRMDFKISADRRRIGVECDGREFHEELRDGVRDALIIAAGAVDVVYRIRGEDIYNHLRGAVYGLAKQEPLAFADDKVELLERLWRPAEHRYEREDPRREGRPWDFIYTPECQLRRFDRRASDAIPWWRQIEDMAKAWIAAGGTGGIAKFLPGRERIIERIVARR